MESQGEREPGVLGMDGGLLESMVQDEIPEQEMLVVQDELPQPNPEPEMGAAAAAAYDTSPPLLRNPPPIPAETAHRSALDRDQIYTIWQVTGGMNNEMKTNVQQMKEEIKKKYGCTGANDAG